MKTYCFDIEVFKNLFTATFVNVDDEKDIFAFYAGIDSHDYSPLIDFLKQEMVLVGYNSDSYDTPMLRAIMLNQKGGGITKSLFDLSSKLIDDNYRSDKSILALRYPRPKPEVWESIDLMRILAFDALGISLKQTAISLKWHKIQDIPLDPISPVRKEDIQMIMDYNMNDVLITKRLYEEIEPLRRLRDELGHIYNTNLSSASNSRVANIILEKIYAEELKANMADIRKRRTNVDKIQLGRCIAPFVHFRTAELNDLKDRIASTVVHNHLNYKYSDKIAFANCVFALGTGGLHSEDAPGEFYSNEEYLIQDMDVASYYPNLIINNGFYPRHLGPDFIKVLKRLTSERLQAKHDGDKVKADGLKITINSIFGKLGSNTFWLYDPKQFLSTTISGQFGLLMLIEKLHLAGIRVISANTDGVVCQIPRKLLDKYYEVAKEWEQETNLELEFTPYKRYIRRDVNTYITEKENGDTKEKGAFVQEIDLRRAYKMPIVQKALYQYFINDIPVKETIGSSKDIMDFCISQKTGGDFDVELHSVDGIEKLQKTNRFYISTTGGSFIKRSRTSGRITGLYVGNTVQILNDYDQAKPFEDYKVDLYFYEKEATKTIEEIRPPQLSLFSMDEVGHGTVSKMEHNIEQGYDKTDTKDVSYLNKLGKNQLLKRVEEIVKTNDSLPTVNSLYAYVLDMVPRSMTATLYALKNGTETEIKVDKRAYKENTIFPGQLIYCKKFRKEGGEFILEEYDITDKLEVDEDALF